MTTKSGTNELHGSVFDYYQTQRLNANSWLNNKLGRPKSIFHRNDFGANVGGPVYVPKVYDGRNRSWFFFSYEGYRFPSTSGVRANHPAVSKLGPNGMAPSRDTRPWVGRMPSTPQ